MEISPENAWCKTPRLSVFEVHSQDFTWNLNNWLEGIFLLDPP